jgi:hypothetical protein
MIDVVVNKVSTDWKRLPGGLTWYFIGQPKTGKTTAASQWSEKGSDGVLLLDTDLGADFVDKANVVTVNAVNPPVRKIKKDGKIVTKDGKAQTKIVPPEERGFYYRTGKMKGKPMPVYSLAEVLSWLRNNWTKLPYDTIVIDTVDEVNTWIERSVTKELNIQAMGEGSWGSDWGLARRKNLDIIVKFQKFMKKNGGNLILISHSKTTTVTDGKAQLSPDLPRGLAYNLTAKADVIGYSTANREDGKYTISFKNYDERAIGSRLKPLVQKELPFDYGSITKEITNYKEQ